MSSRICLDKVTADDEGWWYFKFAVVNGVRQSTDPERFADDGAAREAHHASLSTLALMGPFASKDAAFDALDEMSAE